MGRFSRALACAGASPHADAKKNDEELSAAAKRVEVIRITRHLWSGPCASTGAQVPLIFVNEDLDGTGVAMMVWESQDALVQTVMLGLASFTGDVAPGRLGEMDFIEWGVEASWKDKSEVKWRVHRDGDGSSPASMEIRFGSMRELLDVMYRDCKEQEAALDGSGGSGGRHVGENDAVRRLALAQAQRDALVEGELQHSAL